MYSLQKSDLIKLVTSTALCMGEIFGAGGGLLGLTIGMAAIGLVKEDEKTEQGYEGFNENVDISSQEYVIKNEVEDVETDVDENGWKDGEVLHLFGGDYGNKEDKDVDNSKDNNLEIDSKIDEDVEKIVIKKEISLFGANQIDRDGYIAPDGQEVEGLVFGWAYFSKKG